MRQQQRCVSPHQPEFSSAVPFLQFTHLPVEPERLPRGLCCSLRRPQRPSSLVCHPEISSESDIWTAVGAHKVSFLLPMGTAEKRMISFRYYDSYYYQCQVYIYFAHDQNPLFDEMRGGEIRTCLQRKIALLLAANKMFFPAITDKDHCICGFMIVKTGY